MGITGVQTVAVALLLAPGAGYGIDGLAPARNYEPGKSPAGKPAEPAGSDAAGKTFDWWGFPPSSSKASRPAPGQLQAKADRQPSERVSEMGVISSAEGGEVTAGQTGGKKGPRVHGEAGIYGGGAGDGAFGTAVIEGDKAAVTISGERPRGWWP